MGKRAKRRPQGHPARIAAERERERLIAENRSVPAWQKAEVAAMFDDFQAMGYLEWEETDPETGMVTIRVPPGSPLLENHEAA